VGFQLPLRVNVKALLTLLKESVCRSDGGRLAFHHLPVWKIRSTASLQANYSDLRPGREHGRRRREGRDEIPVPGQPVGTGKLNDGEGEKARRWLVQQARNEFMHRKHTLRHAKQTRRQTGKCAARP